MRNCDSLITERLIRTPVHLFLILSSLVDPIKMPPNTPGLNWATDVIIMRDKLLFKCSKWTLIMRICCITSHLVLQDWKQSRLSLGICQEPRGPCNPICDPVLYDNPWAALADWWQIIDAACWYDQWCPPRPSFLLVTLHLFSKAVFHLPGISPYVASNLFSIYSS